MKLVNLNVSIKIDNTDEVISFLQEQDADIITLQEVTRAREEGVFEEFKVKERLDAALQEIYPYSFFGQLWSSYKQPKRSFGGLLEQGNYILSKYPIVNATNEFFHREFEHVEDWSSWKTQDHARAVQVAEIQVGQKSIQVLNIHGIWTADKKGDERTENECLFISQVAQKKNLPTVIIGDLNLLPESASIKILEKNWKNLNRIFSITKSRPQFSDNLEKGENMVDYAFVNEDIQVESFGTVETSISDHFPLVLTFSLYRK